MEPSRAYDITVYQRSALLREERRRLALAERLQRAQEVAVTAAHLLQEQYGATKVVLYGSVAHGYGFHAESDIDLAVEGIVPAQFWRVWASLDPIDPSFEINLVAVEEATPRLLKVLKTEGVPL